MLQETLFCNSLKPTWGNLGKHESIEQCFGLVIFKRASYIFQNFLGEIQLFSHDFKEMN